MSTSATLPAHDTAHVALLRRAEKLAQPYTRRVAWRLAGLAVLVLSCALLTAFWPLLQQALNFGLQLLGTAFDSVCAFVKALGGLGMSALRAAGAAFVALATLPGLLMGAAGLLVSCGWFRARTYVMQSAIELLVREGVTDLSREEGSALLAVFARTQRRMHQTWGLLAVVSLACAFIVMSRSGLSDLAQAFLELTAMTLGVWAFHGGLSRDRVAAYALFRCCDLPGAEFREQLKERRDNHVTSQMVRLRGLGLLEDSHSATLRVMHAAKQLAVG